MGVSPANLQVPGPGEQRVEAGGAGLGRRRTGDVSQPGQLVLADQACQAPRVVIRLDQEARRVRVVALRSTSQPSAP